MRFLSRAFIIFACITICDFKHSLYGNSIDSLIVNAERLEKSEKFKLAYKNATKALGYINESTSEKEILRIYEVVLRLAWEQNLLNDTEVHARKLLENYSGVEIDFLGHRYLGHACMDLNQTEAAIDSYNAALKFTNQQIEARANILFNIAGIYWDLENFTKSEHFYDLCIELLEDEKDLQIYLAKAYENKGLLYYAWGKNDSALKYFLLSEKTHDKNGCTECLDCTDLFFKIANFYSDALGNKDAAFKYWMKYLIELNKNSLGQTFEYYTALISLGLCAFETGQPQKGIEFLNRATDISQNFLDSHEWLGKLYLNRGNLLSILGRHEEALESYMKVLDILSESSELAEYFPHPYNNISIEYDFLGDQIQRKEYLDKAIHHSINFYGKNSMHHLICLTNLASFYSDNGDLKNSIAVNKRILASNEFEFSENLIPYINLALNYDHLGVDELAFKYAKIFSEKAYALHGDSHRFTAFGLDYLSMCYEEKHNKNKALELALKANEIAENSLRKNFIGSSESIRLKILDYLNEDRNPYDRLASLGHQEGVFLTLLRQKGLVLESIISESNKTLSFLKLETSELLKYIDPSLALIEYVEYNTWKIHNGIEEESTEYGCVLLYQTVSTKSPELHLKWFPLGNFEKVDLANENIREKKILPSSTSINSLRSLHQILIRPVIENLPSSIQGLIICPDSDLSFIPFASLVSEENRFLCEEYEVFNISAARDLMFLSPKDNVHDQEIHIFANPSFDMIHKDETEFAEFALQENILLRGMKLDALPGSEDEGQEVAKLAKKADIKPHLWFREIANEKNLRAIKSPKILHLATHGWFVSNSDKRLKKRTMNFFQSTLNDSASNPMHRSGLALAGAKDTFAKWTEGQFVDSANDGILTAEEASQLDLSDTWLTVLSACDTGSGVARAGEGVLGLRRAFAMAGTQNLLLTLWPVSDSFTKDFMVSFYKEALESGNAPKAMAKVQKEWLVKLREEKSISQAVKLAGPFVLTFRGNPELN
jgi:CHAT domain-containing protein/tetratricopeptide (TPR) repeat protein